MASPNPNLSFAEATKVTALSSHTYSADFPHDWCIGTVPHGGYITSLFLQVAKAHFASTLSSQNQPHTIALHLSFLRRTEIGPALFKVHDTKLGRQTSVISITLSQSSREEVICTLTQSNLHTETGVSFSTNWALNPAPLAADLKRLGGEEGEDANWKRQRKVPFGQFRKATGKTEFYFPKNGEERKGRADEWVRLSTGERWTNESIGYLSDTWPMPVESFLPQFQERKTHYWYPTILLNLDIKKSLPEEGVEWLFARVDTKEIKNGRMDIEVVILDQEGELVALSHHVALAVGAERNGQERRRDVKL